MNRSKSLCAKCFVPFCQNTTTNSRDKYFILVREAVKKKWCQEVNIEYKPGQRLFCCEDHLNLEEDLENYQRFKLMKGRPILKSTAKLRLPEEEMVKFIKEENEDPEDTEEPSVLKALLLQPPENLPITCNSIKKERTDDNYIDVIIPAAELMSTPPIIVNAPTQSHVKKLGQSTFNKGFQQAKNYTPIASLALPSSSGITLKTSVNGSTNKCISQPEHTAKKQILQFITQNPKAYLGMPKQYYWLIKYIVNQSAIKTTELDIIITLFKIKLNDPIHRICDQFHMSRTRFFNAMQTGICILANFLHNLIYMPSLLQINQSQPAVFKTKYSRVVMVLNAFEINVRRGPKCQAETWSRCKRANTVKYLIGSTPSGFVSYISAGFRGMISHKALVEKSGIIDNLPENAVIMADRNFKGIGDLFRVKGINVLHPPSVYASSKSTKEELIQSEDVKSLWVHIRGVVRRIRGFRFLKPHSVVSNKYVGNLDQIVLIACGLINLQNEITDCK